MGGSVLFMNTIAVIFLNYFIIGKFEMPFVFLVGPFFYWMSFYYLGLYISQNQDVIICRKMILWAIMVLFTFQFVRMLSHRCWNKSDFMGLGLFNHSCLIQ